MGSSERLEAEYRELRKGVLLFCSGTPLPKDPLGRLALIEVAGADRLDWLQGQVTNDLRGLAPGSQVDFCMLKPTGQVVADCRMWVREQSCLIQTPRLCAAGLMERFESMVILEDVQARDLTERYSLWSLQGPKAPEAHATIPQATLQECLVLPSDHSGGGGFDLWFPKDIRLEAPALKVPLGNASTLAVAALEAGAPYFGIDMDERTLLPELGPAFEARNVSFQKGCYTGQEIVARIHSRGHTNRTWRALVSVEPLVQSASVAGGTITRCEVSARHGWIAGAMLRNDAALLGDRVEVDSGGHRFEAEVRDFPLG